MNLRRKITIQRENELLNSLTKPKGKRNESIPGY